MRPLPYVGLFLGFFTALVLGSVQQRVEEPPFLSVKTDLVVLPVTVVDRHGRFVTGLAREHFTVYDNGEPQAIQLFTNEDVPWTVGLVIDSSSSMRGKREDVTAAASAFASMSHPLDELFTINFNEAVWPGLPPSVPFAENAEQLHAALSAAPVRGMTALYDAVDRALDHLERGTRDRKALIVVSDGGDNASSQTLEAVLERARRASAAIYSVILFGRDDFDARPSVLKKLARETGGDAFTPTDVDDVMTSFAQIAREIRSGYTIGFSPPEATANGFRAVRVVADAGDRRELVVRTRAGYYAARSNHSWQ